MTNAFNLPSLFFGIYLIIPLILGCFLLFGVHTTKGSLTKAQRLAGALLLSDALYLLIRTMLIANFGLHNSALRLSFFIMDSTMLTIFALIPYTVVTEQYPKWWMYILSISPAALIPIIHYTQTPQLATWSHLIPIIGATTVLFLSLKYAREADKGLKDTYANPEIHEKSWIITICVLFIIVTIASFFRYLLHGFGWYNLTVSLMWSALMITIYIMLIRQKSSLGESEMAVVEQTAEQNVIKKQQTEISKETKIHNMETIGQALAKCEGEQIYLHSDLSIDALARECNTNRTYLSMYLKEELHQNFYDYINSLRLKHVDELMKNAHLSQGAIAMKCGFNDARTMRSAYLKIRGKEFARP